MNKIHTVVKSTRTGWFPCYICGDECPNTRAPGGRVCLDSKLLQYIYELGRSGYIHVNEIAGACHSCNSRHYKGKAVDIRKKTQKEGSEYLKQCLNYGESDVEALGHYKTHIHCGLPL